MTLHQSRSTLAMTLATSTALAVAAGTFAENDGESETGEKITSVYVIPMIGQMGTDVNEIQMEDVIEDVLEHNPDLLIMRIKSADIGTNYHLPSYDKKERGMMKLEEYRDMIRQLQNTLGHIRQVAWVEDCVGVSTLAAFSWPEMYVSPEGRLWGMQMLFDGAQNWSDADVREKMEEAWEGIGRGFLEMGGHGEFSRELGSALIDPTKTLSADFKGRKVIWRPDTKGTWLIDDSDKKVPLFDAETAEDTLLSDGIVESLDDLMFMLGYREYEPITTGQEMIETYKKNWRRSYEACLTNLADIQAGRFGGSNDQLRQLLGQKRLWEEILRHMRRFSAVERRLEQEAGLTKDRVELRIDVVGTPGILFLVV